MLLRPHELELALELGDSVLQGLAGFVALVDFFLVESLARVEERVPEQLKHLVNLLVHLDECAVDEALELQRFPLRDLHRCRHFLMELLDNEEELLDFKLLALDLSVLVLDLAVGDVEL